MSALSSLEDLYWREVAAALRAMVAPGVVVAAAFGAALTLTGASAHGVAPADAACQACLMRLQTPHSAHTPAI